MSKIHKASPRTLARFQKAAAKFGGKVLRAEWEPLGIHLIFDGPIGGWLIKVRFGNHTASCIGRNVENAIEDIEYWGGQFEERLR